MIVKSGFRSLERYNSPGYANDRLSIGTQASHMHQQVHDDGESMQGSLVADVWVFVVGRVLRNPPVLEAGLIRPIVCLLCFPGPLEPATTVLVRYDLEKNTLSLDIQLAMSQHHIHT